MSHKLSRALLAGALLALAPGAAAAEDDPVVATVNGEPLHKSDVLDLADDLQPQMRAQIDQFAPQLVEQLINLTLVNQAAREAGLADDAEVARRLDEVRVDIMRQVYLQRLLDERITDDMLDESYRAHLEANPPEPEIHARHILVETEAEARELIARLDGGAGFEALAQEHSTGPSASQGGDLGFFTRGQMVPAFAEAAFALEPGSHSAEPVETQFGWHVITVLERRESAPPDRAALDEQLREDLRREVINDRVTALREQAEIENVLEPGIFAPAAE